MKYEIDFDLNVRECGDGCCTDFLTNIIVNGKVISTHSSLRCEKELQKVVEYINNNPKDEYVFKSIPEEYGDNDYDYILYIDDIRLGDCDEQTYIVTKLLVDLGFKVTRHNYDINYDKWFDNNEFELDKEVEIEKFNYE